MTATRPRLVRSTDWVSFAMGLLVEVWVPPILPCGLHTFLRDDRARGRRYEKLDQRASGIGGFRARWNTGGPREPLAVLKLFRKPADELVARRRKNLHRLRHHDVGAVVRRELDDRSFHRSEERR